MVHCLIHILVTVGIIAVICVICKRNAFKYLPWKLKIALICWLFVELCYDTYEVLCEEKFGINICGEKASHYIRSMDMAIYLVVDWLFASHYLKMACLFRKAFKSRSVQKVSEIIRCK